MTLVLEIEYLFGVAFAAMSPDNETPDWPPQPDRIFSALVATWAARGEIREERQALEWLEKLPAPHFLASGAVPRTSAIVYVPPNDPRSDKQKHAKEVLPALRSRQPRRFPAARPYDPTVRFFWDGVEPESEMLARLQFLARDTAYIGHSASLTRCRFLLDEAACGPTKAMRPSRWIYDGRFAELRRTFGTGHRPLSGARVSSMPDATPPRTNVFGDHWLILEHVAGDMPDIRACTIVAKTIRDALLSGYRRIGIEDTIPEVISGHSADGKPARSPHLAIVPLPFAGFPYADGHVMGFALVPPQGSAILNDDDFGQILRALGRIDNKQGRRILTIKTKGGTAADRAFSIDLAPTFEPRLDRRSLDPCFYVEEAQNFATVTPIALDRHLKNSGEARQDEIKALIACACRNIGLPEPIEVAADKHSAFEGVPSAYPSGRSPTWMRWRLPASLASRQLAHAVLRFSEPVKGPIMLGAGRFLGLGLCRPIDLESGHALR